MKDFYTDLTFKISRLVTRSYSNSFSLAVSRLDRDVRNAIYSIYGFVRFADEIVDSFHHHDKKYLLEKFEADYYDALKRDISLNPLLHSFAGVVKKYEISDDLVQAFLKSMRTDLTRKDFETDNEIGEYIYGSAEVVGLMCLRVFLHGNEVAYSALEEPAKKLGSAFQKVNFLRDLKNDTENLGRRYFPAMIGKPFNETLKNLIISDIENDFRESYEGMKKLPARARFGVLTAYRYYRALLKKIKKTPAETISQKRIRISSGTKLLLLARAYLENSFNLL